MITLRKIFYFILLCFCNVCFCQEIKPLRINDTVPDIIFKDMINYKGSTSSLSDFDGKAIILDFWATWCIPCVASFPKMENYQKEYPKDLKIIMVSDDKRDRIENFYQTKSDFSLPTAVFTKEDPLNRYFPYTSIPHYVWINRDRKIVAITNYIDFSKGNLENLFSGKEIAATMVTPDSVRKSYIGKAIDSIQVIGGRINRISRDNYTVYESRIRSYDERLTHLYYIDPIGTNGKLRVQLVNCSIVDLISTAFLGMNSTYEDRDSKVILSNDTTLDYPATDNETILNNWERSNSYSYYLTYAKEHADSLKLFKTMQKDLGDYFAVQAEIKEQEITCMVLRRISNYSGESIKSKNINKNTYSSLFKIELKNQPISSFFKIIRSFGINRTHNFSQPRMPIVNEANIDFNVDLTLNCKVSDIEEVNKQLYAYGLQLNIEPRVRQVLILRKN